ncbi:MAG: ParA family protein [Candidatus Hydrogenedentes bacterium]|nr:ParA family protein [Candidatus Hydrogenedentota bacterium]
MARIIAVANQKGGVGKTTTAVNLAACFAEAGKKVLLLDLDPQGNASQGVGVDKNKYDTTIYDVLVDHVPLDQVVLATNYDNLSLVPSHRDLVGAEIELVGENDREFRLRNAIVPVQDAYDYIVLDCPPALGLLTLNGLVAATGVIIPLQCEYYALEGLSELLHTIILVRDNLNADLAVKGVLLTMYQHTNLSRQVMEDVRNHLGTKVFETWIPRNVSLSEAPSYGMPIIHYDNKCAGARYYRMLAQEVDNRA